SSAIENGDATEAINSVDNNIERANSDVRIRKPPFAVRLASAAARPATRAQRFVGQLSVLCADHADNPDPMPAIAAGDATPRLAIRHCSGGTTPDGQCAENRR